MLVQMSFSRYSNDVRLFVCLGISILSFSWLGAVIVKEVETFGVASFQHAGSVSEVVCHPNGIHALSSSRDQCVRLWEIKSGKLVHRYTVPGCGDMWGIRFLKNGKEFLAASSSNDVFRFELATGKVLQKYAHSGTAYRLAVLPDEKSFIGTDGKNTAVLWETATGKKLRTFSGHTKDVYTAIIVNGGKTLITGSEDKSIKQWNIATGECLKTITDKPAFEDVFTLATSPNKKRFAMVCDGGYAGVFDSATLEEIWKTKLGEEGEVVAWSPDGSLIASTSDDGNLYLFHPETGEISKKIKTVQKPHTPITFTNDSKFIISGGDSVLHVHSVETGDRLEPEMGFSDDGTYDHLAVGLVGSRVYVSKGSSWQVLDREDPERNRKFTENQKVTSIALSDGGDFIAIGFERGQIKVFDTSRFELLSSMSDKGSVDGLAFLPDGKRLVAGGGNNRVTLWAIEGGRRLRDFEGHTDDVVALALSNDGELLMTLSKDRSIRSWSVMAGDEQAEFKLANNRPSGIAYFDDGRSLVISTKTKNVLARILPEIRVEEVINKEVVLELIKQLADDRFLKRQEAMEKLAGFGKAVIPIAEAIETEDPEVEYRLVGVRDTIRGSLTRDAFKKVATLDDSLGVLATDPRGEFWVGKLGDKGASRLLVGVVDRESEGIKILQTIDNEHGCLQLSFSRDGSHLGTVNADGTFSLFKVFRE
ncbi:MAG: WD40 repeat domain-containing protein [Verrucomicrobiaceae bacterium]|nr:MAG: WD40 repeat domain-containing protein [Verrucomicrobiaceae bacterium]